MPELSFEWILFIVFGLCWLIILWYYLYYFSRVAFHKEPDAATQVHPPVSIVICARNEDHNLPEFLPLILSQDYPEYEVVVVDDCSWDNTPDVLRELEKKYSRLKVITIKEDPKHYHGKKFALMVGIKGASHEKMLLTDGDCRPEGDQWLKRMAEGFIQGKEIVLGYSQYERRPGLLNRLIRFDTFLIALQYLSFAKAGSPYMGVGRNLAYHKSLFFRNKGFSTHYHLESGDDDLFINEVATSSNTSAVLSNGSFTISRVKKDWKGWIEQKRRHLTTWKMYGKADQWRLGVYPVVQVIYLFTLIGLLLMYPFQLFTPYDIWIVAGMAGARLLLQGIIFWMAMGKLKERDLFLISLVAELFLLAFYPALTVSNALFRRKQWKRI